MCRRAVVLAVALAGCSQRGETPTRSAAQGDRPVDAEGSEDAPVSAVERAQPRGEPLSEPTAREDERGDDEPAGIKPVIATVVLGSFPEDLREAVEAGVRESLPVEVRRGETWELPREAYYPPRRRYRADTLIDLLSEAAERDPEEGVRYLGLASVDISTTKGKHKDWGIFGLAFCPGRGAVISMHRLKKGVRDREHFAFRVTNTAIHEVGHSLGLEHCDEPRCPMRDAEGSIATTDSSGQVLGPECAAKLAASLAR